MSFDRSDHLRPLDCIVWLSRRTHKTAGEDNRELCQHQDYSPHEPQCVGVAAHVGELTEDRIAQEVFQPLASSSSTIAQPTAIRVRGIACLSLRGFVQVAASEHGVGAAAFIGVPGQRPHRPRGREALTPAVCISIRAKAAATLLRGNHTVIDRQQKPIVGLVSAGLCQHQRRHHRPQPMPALCRVLSAPPETPVAIGLVGISQRNRRRLLRSAPGRGRR